mmetsp:Transcript_16907/g.34888  ORF Transcript_16907/g.34888 Transcript_16907/m.34888 type:complete len:260 (+) Transcript_16907:171-950(+)
MGRDVVVPIPKSPRTTAVVPLAIVDPINTPPDGMVNDSRIPAEEFVVVVRDVLPPPSRLPMKLETNCASGLENDCRSYVPLASPRAPTPNPRAATPRLTLYIGVARASRKVSWACCRTVLVASPKNEATAAPMASKRTISPVADGLRSGDAGVSEVLSVVGGFGTAVLPTIAATVAGIPAGSEALDSSLDASSSGMVGGSSSRLGAMFEGCCCWEDPCRCRHCRSRSSPIRKRIRVLSWLVSLGLSRWLFRFNKNPMRP